MILVNYMIFTWLGQDQEFSNHANNVFLLSSLPKNPSGIYNNSYQYSNNNNCYLCSIFTEPGFVLSILLTVSPVILTSLQSGYYYTFFFFPDN